jgi:purine-cytosine permease-like protein
MKEIMDWVSLAGNSLWVAGCALALAVISGVSGTARPGGFREHLGKPLAQMGLSLAFFLISAGQAEVAVPVWEKMIWVLLGLVFLVSTWHSLSEGIRLHQRKVHTPNDKINS